MTPDPMTGRKRSVAGEVLGLVGWLALAFAAAAIGSIASIDAGSFYARLERPSWAPPASVFGPVWSTLYFLMGVAAWLAWREPASPGRSRALALFVVQLVVNALWSWLFFAWRLGLPAFVEVVALLALVAATAIGFWRVRPLAGVLLVPYLGWVGFATALTWAIWRGNPAAL